MVVLALLALVASVMVWASPSSQAQANQAPFADAGTDQRVNPGAAVELDGTGSVDVDGTGAAGDGITGTGCNGCEFEWEIETGPYDWINKITNYTNADTAMFNVPSEAFVDKVADSDPQKYEIVVRLTVTDDDGATASDTVSIYINQRPVADIQVYAGLRDKDVVDGDLGAHGHFPTDAVIDGPGENGNRDNEWDIMEGAYLQLDGSGSTDENPRTGKPSSYQWTRVRPTDTLAGYAVSQSAPSAGGQRLNVAADNGETGDASNVVVINFGDLDGDGTANEVADATATPPQIAETISVATLPDVEPNMPQTVFYQLTVCDSRTVATADITTATNCTEGRTGASLIRIVVHDTSAAPEVSFNLRTGAVLTAASADRGDAAPQGTASQFTGVENQFIVAAGSAVRLTATVEDDDQASGHVYRWSGATAVPETATATVRVPADADDGDTIDGSVTVIDATRISVTATFQLLVGENTVPTAGGVPANMDSIDNPQTQAPVIYVHKVTDGFQSRRDGSTVTLRGVGNDADGDAIITAWALREGPDHAALNTAIGTWITAIEAIASDANAADRAAATAAASGAALGTVGAALQDMQEPDEPLFELSGALTDTVSFDVPNLKNGEDKGTILLFNVIDSNGVPDVQIVYVYVSADDDPPDAKAGDDQQVDPETFVRLNGSASSDPDVGDEITFSWAYAGATMDPAPDDRSPLSDSEIDELKGWILRVATDAEITADAARAEAKKETFKNSDGDSFVYIVDSDGKLLEGESSTNLKSTSSAYPYFDAPDLSGFNNLALTFELTVTDSADDPRDDDDEDGEGGAGDTDGGEVPESDSDSVTVTVVNRFFSGNIPGPDFCTNRSLGGPQTYAFDGDGDGVADACSLNTTRRATVARQNALETLANLNPTEFRNAVNAECGKPGFKQADYGDDPDDLDSDVCETERVTPPPAAADPATADEFFSGTITGPDYCTNHSLGGARTYAFDSDSDDVADVCSLPTTRREAIARQSALESRTFIETFSANEQTRHDEIAELIALTGNASRTDEQTTRMGVLNEKYASDFEVADTGTADSLEAGDEVTKAQAEVDRLASKKTKATRYSNALAAACRALGSQDFGDAASALARDECVTDPATGRPLS